MGESGQNITSHLRDLAQSLGRADAPSDADLWLDGRDAPDFEDRWLSAHSNVPGAQQAWIADVRETAYLTVHRSTGNGDVAAYVSDDLELISRFAVAGVEDQWVQGLLAVYIAGELPSGQVEPDPRSIPLLLGVPGATT